MLEKKITYAVCPSNVQPATSAILDSQPDVTKYLNSLAFVYLTINHNLDRCNTTD